MKTKNNHDPLVTWLDICIIAFLLLFISLYFIK